MISIKELKELAQNYTVLYVEDEESVRAGVSHYLNSFFKKVDVGADGEEGLSLYKNSSYDIVFTDIEMPKMNGLEMSAKIKEINADQEILIISAYSDSNMFLTSIRIGVSGYIIKPIDYKQINEALYRVIYKLDKFRENELYKTNLEGLVKEKTQELSTNYKNTVLSLVDMVDKRDSYTGKHSQRVAEYSRLIAQEMGYDKEACKLIYNAGILHDIGKIATPDSILLKPSRLENSEYKIIQEHVTMSHNILTKIPMYKNVADIIMAHHEHYDGSGYPNGLKGDEIPELARIMIVADAFDAMTTNRIYKVRKNIDVALKELKDFSAIHFHPAVVDAASKVLSKVNVSDKISQLPTSALEEERFSYFYKDQLTNLYNSKYLDLLLRNNVKNRECKYLYVIFLNNFSNYNVKHGWIEGDKFLIEYARLLSDKCNEKLLFRIYGDDFMLLKKERFTIDKKEFEKEAPLAGTEITISIKEFDIEAQQIDSMIELEEIIMKYKTSLL